MTSEDYYKMWIDFKESISYRQRFFNTHEILNIIDEIANDNQITIDENSFFYRARIYDESLGFAEEFEKMIRNYSKKAKEQTLYDKLSYQRNIHSLETREKSGFWGFDNKGSHIPDNPDVVSAGRSNAEKIRYLYVANEPLCAVAEVRPLIKDYVSVAEIKNREELRIVDFTYNIMSDKGERQILGYLIMEQFSKPNNNKPFDYLPTQYISDFIRSKHYDGIMYNSSLYGRGRNYVIFNPDKCCPISSKLYKLEEVCLDLKCIGPVGDLLGENDLYHWKLKDYKEQRKREFIESLKK